MRILLFSAFPREVRGIVRLTGRGERMRGFPFTAFSIRLSSHVLFVAETGLGVENAGKVFLRLLRSERPDAVVSLGYCGALTDESSVGDVIWASSVCLIDGQKVERLSLPDGSELLEALALRVPIRPGTFLTMKEWRKKGDLLPLVDPGMALPVCDMETFAIARLCRDHKLPFYGLRAVSDPAGKELGFDPRSVCDSEGAYRVWLALELFLTRPRLLTRAMELRRTSKIASRNLGRAVAALLDML
jgi:nucleoside phosphorylase